MEEKKKKSRLIDKLLMGAVIGGAIGSVVGATMSKKDKEEQPPEPLPEPKRRTFSRVLGVFKRKKKEEVELKEIPLETEE